MRRAVERVRAWGADVRLDGWLVPALAVAGFTALTLLQNLVYDYEPLSDSLVYLARAKEFAGGDFLNPRTNWNYAPGYSLFLAALFAVGADVVEVLVGVQAALLAGAYVFLLRRLRGRGVLSPEGSALALAAWVLNPIAWAVAGGLLSEPFVAALLMLLAGVLLGTRPASPASLAAVAAVAGWLVLSRFEYLLLLPLLAALAWGLHGRAPRRVLLAMALGPALLLAGNAARNQAIFGKATPVSLGGGVVLYGGANVTGDGTWHQGACTASEAPGYLPADMLSDFHAACALEADEPVRAYLALDSLYRVAAFRQWRREPATVVAAWPTKLVRLWLMPAHFDIYIADRTYRKGLLLRDHLDPARWPWYGVAKHVVYIGLHWALLALATAGLVVGLRGTRDQRRWALFTGGLAVALTLLMVVLFYGLPRFHAPLLPLLLASSGMALSRRGATGDV